MESRKYYSRDNYKVSELDYVAGEKRSSDRQYEISRTILSYDGKSKYLLPK